MNQLQDNTLLNHGRYRVVRYLASGGFGNTYEAADTVTNKPVAIKELFIKDCCSRDFRTNMVTVGINSKTVFVLKMTAKFIREAKRIHSLSLSNIVRCQMCLKRM